MTNRAKLLTLVMLALMVAAALYLRVLTRRVSMEAPPFGEQAARTRLSEAALQSEAAPQQTATLYFPSYDQGTLVSEERQVSWAKTDTDRIRQVLLALIEGSHQGYSRGLPAAVKIRAVFLASDGTAYLDFESEGLEDIASGISSECLAVYSVVNSLAVNIPAVKKVKILLQGKEVDTLDGHADLSDAFVPDPSLISSAP
jgi:spore germination protein GerM